LRAGAVCLLASFPVIGFAARTPKGPTPSEVTDALTNTGIKTSVNSIGSVQQVIQDIIGWVQVFILVISVLFIIMGAWDYLNSGGEAEKTKEGRNKLIYATVGIALVLIAGGIVRVINTFIN